MENNRLIDFYENILKIETFTRIKTVYDLTNNIDVFLLRYLRRDCFKYYIKKLESNLINFSNDNDETEIKFVIETVLSDDVFVYDNEECIDYLNQYFTPDFLDELQNVWNVFFVELDYLESLGFSKINKSNKESDSNTDFYINKNINDNIIDNFENFNISNIKKIIYLNELGIIDYLKSKEPFNTSINSLAKIISTIIGANPTSIQPILNAMFGNQVNEKNNPLNSEKNVAIVREYLINIGFKR